MATLLIDVKRHHLMKRFITFWVIPILLQSCSTMYIPAIRSIPLLEKQGEFQMEAGVSTNSVYANISGAITDNIAVSLNGNLSYRNFTDYYDLFTHKDDEGPNVKIKEHDEENMYYFVRFHFICKL